MSLTTDDLKAIREVVREEVENEATAIKDELSSDMRMSGIRIQADVRELKDRIKNFEIRISNNHKEIKKEIKQVADFLDKQDVELHKRVKQIEKHLNLSQN